MMKKYTFIIIVLIAVKFSFSQNLVPNPSFEEYTKCPDSQGQTNRCVDWIINVNTVDYFNICSSKSTYGIPKNCFSYQCAKTGSAYMGMYFFSRNLGKTDAREYLGCKLKNQIQKGKKYHVSFNVSFNDNRFCSENKMGILFTNSNLGGNFIQLPPPLINNIAHIYSNNIISDTVNWTNIKGSFIADSNYQYLLIGNFFEIKNIDTLCGVNCLTTQYCYGAYYFVDDIYVGLDSIESLNIKNEIVDFKADTTTLILDKCLNLKVITNVNYKSYKWIIIKNEILYKSFIAKDTNICFDKIGKFTIKMIATNNNGCGDTVIKYNYINVYPTESINKYEVLKENIINQNPVKDKLKLNIDISLIKNIELINSYGQSIFSANSLKSNEIDVSLLPKGIFIVKISTNNNLYINKIIIQ